MKSRFFILLAFALTEVILYGENPALQLIVSILEYSFILYKLHQSKSEALFFYMGFTILGIKAFGADTQASMMFNYLRLGVSFNIIFSLIISILLLRLIKIRELKLNAVYKFLFLFSLYSFALGILNLLTNRTYSDFFLNDLFTYFPIFIYFVMLKSIGKEYIFELLFLLLPVSCCMLFISFVLNKTFIYGESLFLIENTFTYILVFSLLMWYKDYPKIVRFSMFFLVGFFLFEGKLFLSGKFIIVVLPMLLFFVLKVNGAKKYIYISMLLLLFYYLEDLLLLGVDTFRGNIISFKFDQIHAALVNLGSLESLAFDFSSMGNIIAESLSIVKKIINEPFSGLFGDGFGGTVQDYYGYLAPFAGNSGYPDLSLIRNAYYKMHLPILELVLKAGLIITLWYFFLGFKVLMKPSKYCLLFLILFFTVFYVNKESLLLTMLMLQAHDLKVTDVLVDTQNNI